MDVHLWETPIEATWHRANRLADLSTSDGLIVRIIEENTDRIWSLQFTAMHAFKLVTEDCAEWSKKPLPPEAGFFKITDSPWLEALGIGESDPEAMEHIQHFAISMQDGILEIAAHDCTFS